MIWSAGLRIAADYPLLGVGDIDLGDLLRAYASPGYPGIWGHVHNTFLQFLVTLGIIGLVVVTLMFVKILVEEWRVYRNVREDWLLGSTVLGGIAVMVGIQTQGLVEWSFGDQEVAILLWLTVGLALAAGRIARDPAADRSS
jgi:O-antigen ligase